MAPPRKYAEIYRRRISILNRIFKRYNKFHVSVNELKKLLFIDLEVKLEKYGYKKCAEAETVFWYVLLPVRINANVVDFEYVKEDDSIVGRFADEKSCRESFEILQEFGYEVVDEPEDCFMSYDDVLAYKLIRDPIVQQEFADNMKTDYWGFSVRSIFAVDE